ncbi:MAG TPA: hypothetical protein V6C78_01980 [Crinalium sp.]
MQARRRRANLPLICTMRMLPLEGGYSIPSYDLGKLVACGLAIAYTH